MVKRFPEDHLSRLSFPSNELDVYDIRSNERAWRDFIAFTDNLEEYGKRPVHENETE